MNGDTATAITAEATIVLAVVGAMSTIGTLILAFFTYRLARATVQLGNESERDRLDNLAPEITIQSFDVFEMPLQRSPAAGQPDNLIEPNTQWSLKQHGGVEIGVQASGTLFNEGRRTALLLIMPGPTVIAGVASRNRQGDRYVLPPGESAHVTLVRWRTMKEWGDDWQASGGRPARASNSATLSVTSQMTGAVVDELTVSFGTFPFVPHPTNDSWVTGRTGQPGVPPPPSVIVGDWRRQYLGLEPARAVGWRRFLHMRHR